MWRLRPPGCTPGTLPAIVRTHPRTGPPCCRRTAPRCCYTCGQQRGAGARCCQQLSGAGEQPLKAPRHRQAAAAQAGCSCAAQAAAAPAPCSSGPTSTTPRVASSAHSARSATRGLAHVYIARLASPYTVFFQPSPSSPSTNTLVSAPRAAGAPGRAERVESRVKQVQL